MKTKRLLLEQLILNEMLDVEGMQDVYETGNGWIGPSGKWYKVFSYGGHLDAILETDFIEDGIKEKIHNKTLRKRIKDTNDFEDEYDTMYRAGFVHVTDMDLENKKNFYFVGTPIALKNVMEYIKRFGETYEVNVNIEKVLWLKEANMVGMGGGTLTSSGTMVGHNSISANKEEEKKKKGPQVYNDYTLLQSENIDFDEVVGDGLHAEKYWPKEDRKKSVKLGSNLLEIIVKETIEDYLSKHFDYVGKHKRLGSETYVPKGDKKQAKIVQDVNKNLSHIGDIHNPATVGFSIKDKKLKDR